SFLTSHFNHYVDYGFTANMEDSLDSISNGKRQWVPVLRDFWRDFSRQLAAKQNVSRGTPLEENCPKCGRQLYLQNSRRGLFVGCSGYPACDYIRPWKDAHSGPTVLGTDPASGKEVLLLKGPYGFYVQLGQTVDAGDVKPKRAAWPKNIPVASAEIDTALKLLSLPRQLGLHPGSGKPVEANIGRFGPYVKHDGAFKSIPKTDNIFGITLERAVELLAQEKGKGSRGRRLGAHPEDQRAVTIHNGRYGPYVKHGPVNATIPQDIDADKISLDQALELLAARAAKTAGGKRAPRKAAGKSPPAKR